MITESFLNTCFSLILNKKSKIKNPSALYRDILEIIQFGSNRATIEIPVTMQTKLDCLKKITTMLLENKTIDTVLDSIAFSEKFKQHRDFLDIKIHEDIADNVFFELIKQLRLRKKINNLFNNYDDLKKVLDAITDGSFDSIDDLVNDYEATIKTLYTNMMETNRSTIIEASASLDLTQDDYEHVKSMIIRKYDKSNKTPCGFKWLDDNIFHGGYDPSRLYIWGGMSGGGKSTLLNNSLIYSATTHNPNCPPVKGEIHNIYIYVTLENTIEESLMRTYMPLFNVDTTQFLTELKGGVDIKGRLQKALEENSNAIIMKYYPATSISAIDLMGVLDDAKNQYPDAKIAGLYLDYLDLLRTDTKFDLYRIELGQVTLALKTLAVQYNIPIITGTQLGRPSYNIKDSASLGVDMISESIKKVEHADFVGLLAKDPFVNDIVHGKIGKNRAGKSNMSMDFKVDFTRFKFISVTPAAMQAKTEKEAEKESAIKKHNPFNGIHCI